MHKTNDGRMPPVIHVDTDAPLYSDIDGKLITDKLWGLYYKPDFEFRRHPGRFIALCGIGRTGRGDGRSLWSRQPRFRGRREVHRKLVLDAGPLPEAVRGQVASLPPRGEFRRVGCFTPDSFPVFDVFRDNVYVIADSNHGYKMLGVGKLVAGEIAARAHGCSSPSGSRAMSRASSIRCPGPVPLELIVRAAADHEKVGERSEWPPTMRNSPRRAVATI